MDILTVLQTIARRWFIVLPIVAVTLGVAFMVGSSAEPEYALEGTVLLVTESGASSVEADPAAVVSAPVLAEVLRSADARQRLAQAGASVPYSVEADPVTSILRVSATSSDPVANVATVEAVLDNLGSELEQLEEATGVAVSNRATVKPLLRPSDQSDASAQAAVGSAYLVPSGVSGTNPLPPNGYTTRIIEEVMLGAEARLRVAEQAGGAATYTVTQQARDAAPILSISVLSTDPGVAEGTFEAVKETISQVLDERQSQANVEERRRTLVNVLNAPAGAIETSGTIVKSVVIIVGLGFLAAATAAILVESVVASYKGHRPRWGQEKGDDDEDLFGERTMVALGDESQLSNFEERAFPRR